MVGITCLYGDSNFAVYRYVDLFSVFHPPSLLSWMFGHGCLDSCCFGCVICLCFIVCTCSAQLNMFHVERHTRNTVIIFIIIIIMTLLVNSPTLRFYTLGQKPLYSVKQVVEVCFADTHKARGFRCRPMSSFYFFISNMNNI